MQKNTLLSIILIALAVFILWSVITMEREFGGGPAVILDGKNYQIEVANNEISRARGLSGRSEIGSTGLLFVFKEKARPGIWMNDMSFPIDILWLDEEFLVVHIEKDVSPDTFPSIFYPSSYALYVFEAEAGFSDKFNIEVGQKMNFIF
jgi:uncharacterized protein